MKRICLFVCFAIMMANIVGAQNLKKYEGEIRYPSDLKVLSYFIGDYMDGKTLYGSYYYYENQDGERIKNGNFQLIYKNGNGVNFRVLRGEYSNGLKSGQWIIKDSIARKEYIKVHRLGTLKITYKNDIINGPCEYHNKYLKGSFSYSTIKCNFNNGIIVGEVTVRHCKESDTTKVREYKGSVSNDGLLHGLWTIKDKGGLEMLQKRLYYKGGLVSVEESDFSTGDKYMCYSAFDGMTKTPDINAIKDTIVNGLNCIMWNGKIAVKTAGYADYNSKMTNTRMGDVVFESFQYSLYSTLENQRQSWGYRYSEQELVRIRKERELFVQDSIRKEQQLREQQLKEANANLSEELLGYISVQTDKKIKKSSVEGNNIVFQAQPEAISGEFKEEYMKNSMGETYINENQRLSRYKTKVLSNKKGNVILLKFEKDSKNIVYLIHKNGQKSDVFEVTKSALKGLPIEW